MAYTSSAASRDIVNEAEHDFTERDTSEGVASDAYVVLADRYELIRQLAWKSAGRIFIALDRQKIQFGAKPYVSVLVPSPALADERPALTNFLSTARSWQTLGHPHIAAVRDFRRDQEICFLSIEALPGNSLANELRTRKLSPAEAMAIITTVGQTLADVHGRGLVHGRLAPLAISIDESANLKLLDPGLVDILIFESYARMQLRVGSVPHEVGMYLSPESLQAAPTDARADVYSFACLAYELMTGLHPFDGMNALDAEAGNYRVRKLKPLSDRQVKAFCRALSFKADKRTKSVQAFLRELAEASRPRTARGAVVISAVAASVITCFGTNVSMDLLSAFNPSGVLANIASLMPDEAQDATPTLAHRKRHATKHAEDLTQRAPARTQTVAMQKPMQPPSFYIPPYPQRIPEIQVDKLHTVDELLAYADKQMAIKQYAGIDSAAEALLKILQVNPRHPEARQRLNTIVSYFEQQGRTFIESHEWHRAENMLVTAKAIDPANESVKQALSELSTRELLEDERPTIGGISRERYLLRLQQQRHSRT